VPVSPFGAPASTVAGHTTRASAAICRWRPRPCP